MSILATVSSALDGLGSLLDNTLNQTVQDVGGTWGTLDNPLLPISIGSAGVSAGLPWGSVSYS